MTVGEQYKFCSAGNSVAVTFVFDAVVSRS
jgi:hypothetical protein